MIVEPTYLFSRSGRRHILDAERSGVVGRTGISLCGRDYDTEPGLVGRFGFTGPGRALELLAEAKSSRLCVRCRRTWEARS